MAYVKDKQELDKKLAEKSLLNETEEDVSNKPKSVFAKFKNYNTTDKKKAISAETKNTKQYYVLTERANRFKYRGKLNEYLAVDKTAAGNSQAKIDYSSFKLLNRVPDIKLD
jgi:predicted signal transduction protein with EAL and GGDEF domain